ncbi:MAG: gluconeogenesis factor YvcK family protein [Caldisericaceae bacterium]
MRTIEKSRVRWMYPGLRIKRFIVLAGLGLIMLLYGVGLLYFNFADTSTAQIKKFFLIDVNLHIPNENIFLLAAAAVIIIIAAALITTGVKRLVVSVASCLAPGKSEQEIMDVVFSRRKENLKKKIVVIGGGTGTTSVLEGLRGKFVRVAAVITVADSGGSSGRIRRELKIPPPGDIRNCLVALTEENSLTAKLLSYRFQESDSCLDGHNLGNIIISGLTRMTGDFGDAVISLAHILDIDGEVMPFTIEDVTLAAEFEDGSVIEGEADITNHHGRIKKMSIKPDDAKPYIKALERISEADVLVFGPGSLFTSVIPPLLFTSMVDTVRRSRAQKVFVVNIMTEPGETDDFKASDHIKAFENIVGKGVIDYAIVNIGDVSKRTLKKYESAGSYPVIADLDNIRKMGVKCVKDNLVLERGDVIRHNSERLGEAIFKIAKKRV